MRRDQGMTKLTSQDYVRIVSRAERHAADHGLASQTLFTDDFDLAQATVRELYRDAEFERRNRAQQGKFRKALSKLMVFYSKRRDAEPAAKPASAPAPKADATPKKPAAPARYSRDADGFRSWLAEELGMAENTCSTIVSAVKTAERTARESRLSSIWLFTADPAKAQATAEALFSDVEFLRFNRYQNNRFRNAISRLLEFYGVEKPKSLAQLYPVRKPSAFRPTDGSPESAEPRPGAVRDPDFQRRLAQDFYPYLISEKKLTRQTAQYYCQSIEDVKDFLIEKRIDASLDGNDPNNAQRLLYDVLLKRDDFVAWNRFHLNRYSVALAQYVEFLRRAAEIEARKAAELAKPTPPRQQSLFDDLRALQRAKSNDLQLDAKTLVDVLAESFPKGFRLGSALEMIRFRRFYFQKTGKELKEDDDKKVETFLISRGLVFEGRLYYPDAALPEDEREKILDYIDALFDEGKTTIYYAALYQKFQNELGRGAICNPETLKTYLAYYLADQNVVFRNKFLTVNRNGKFDPRDEIRTCLKERCVPMALDELFEILEHIDQDAIRTALWHNLEFVRNSKGEFFHADCLELTDGELERIAKMIERVIRDQDHLTGQELYDMIREKLPNAFERNEVFSVIGWRDALKYKLEGRFSFTADVISSVEASKGRGDLFVDFAKSRRSFTLEELESFANEQNTPIAFDSLYTWARRVSYDRFVRKDDVEFNVSETDAFLSRICRKYVPFSEILEYSVFPEASHPWNEYLLEQYVAFYSDAFEILRGGTGGFAKSGVSGVIVKRSSRFANFDALAASVLAESGVALRKDVALDYLVENGYIARRRLSSIETVLADARAKRNRKGI